MADAKKPGPVCLFHGASGIDAGTLARVCSAAPGNVGSQSFGQPRIVPTADLDMAQWAMLRAIPKMPADVRAAVAGLFTPQSVAIICGAAAISTAAHRTGFGEEFNVIVADLAIGFLGKDALRIGSRFHSFWVRATTAQDEGDLDAAAGYFASAVSSLGIEVVLGFVACSSSSCALSGRETGGTISRVEVHLPRPSERTDRARLWPQAQKTLAAVADDLSRELALPYGRSVFYAGDYAGDFYRDGSRRKTPLGEVATRWARSHGRFTIDMTKAGETLYEVAGLLRGLFGSFRWVEDVRPGWGCLSKRLAMQAGGEVHAFVRGRKKEIDPNVVRYPQPPSGGERRAEVRGAGSVFWEIEFPEMVLSLRANPKVTEITFHVCDEVGREIDTVNESKRL